MHGDDQEEVDEACSEDGKRKAAEEVAQCYGESSVVSRRKSSRASVTEMCFLRGARN